jgi:hypothetical protein
MADAYFNIGDTQASAWHCGSAWTYDPFILGGVLVLSLHGIVALCCAF